MKVPPKRKGNATPAPSRLRVPGTLNESPSEKEGKWSHFVQIPVCTSALNESPSEKEGKFSPVWPDWG